MTGTLGLILLLAASAPARAEDRPTFPGMSADTYQNFSEMIAGGIHGVGVPAAASCPPEAGSVHLRASRINRACRSYYDRMMADGELSFGIGIGYLDPAVDGNSPNDRFLTIVDQLTAPCSGGVTFSCGFERSDLYIRGAGGRRLDGTDFTVLTKRITYTDSAGRTRSTTVRVNVCNPYSASTVASVRTNQQTTCSAQFSQSMRYDDVTTYIGHSRYGGGPDFSPPVLTGTGADRHEDHAYYENNRPGVNRFFSPAALKPPLGSTRARPEYKQVYMLSCSSRDHFTTKLRENSEAAGYGPDSFDFAGTTNPVDDDGTEGLRLLESIGTGTCAGGIARNVRNSGDERFSPSATEGFQMIGRPPNLDVRGLFNASR